MSHLNNQDGSITVQDSVITVQDCIEEGAKLFEQNHLFFGHGTDNAADEALWIVFFQLQLPWDSDTSVLQKQVADSDYKQILSLFQRRVDERIPVAYLTGEAWFAGYSFIVSSDVLIPRSPIAELINQGFSPWADGSDRGPLHILDLCTGSGCIGIASALALPQASVTLSDICPKALAVAKQNIQRYDLNQRVKTVESDLFKQLANQRFDLIVSNPPYVDAADFAAMPVEYQSEPELALVSGNDGLDFTRRLLNEAANYLTDEGVLICEVGNSWVHMESAFAQVPFLWLEFEQGGHGVFVITRQELIEYQAAFVL